MSTTAQKIDGIAISNADKVMFPDCDITKGELIDHYRRLADVLLPQIAQRPLTLHRFPDGISAQGFYQQRSADHFPDWLETVSTPRAGGDGRIEHVLANNRRTLVYLANLATVTLHGWLSRQPHIDCPDRLVFDLDPADDDFASVRRAAQQLVALLRRLKVHPFVMTTGSRGLHVVVPLRAEADFASVRSLAGDMAQRLARQYPDELTTEQRRDRRDGRLYLDVTRNAYGQTAVVPYAVRALPGAPVATPLDLAELDDSALGPRRWHLRNIRRRLGQKGDPWSGIRRHAVSVARLRRSLDALGDGG